MLYAITSDPLLSVVLSATTILAIAAATITIRVGSLRSRQTRHAEQEALIVARWRPHLLDTVDAVPDELPTVKRAEWFVFLILWNQFHESLKGPARHRLKAVALQLKLDAAARDLLKSNSADKRLVAVIALGYLGDKRAWKTVEDVVQSQNSLLSMAALRSLFLIDASRAVDVLLSSHGARTDWQTAQLKTIVAEADSSIVSDELVRGAGIAMPAELPRLIALMDSADATLAEGFLRALLRTSKDVEVLVACLKSRHLPKNLGLITPLARNPSWQVRTQLARALGSMIARGEEHILIAMLSDDVWWVRFRAAQSLARLPFLSNEELWRLRSMLNDRFAKDILDHVVADEKLQ
jgi:hypothetical protein